jgi:hypothetical protein
MLPALSDVAEEAEAKVDPSVRSPRAATPLRRAGRPAGGGARKKVAPTSKNGVAAK